MAEILVVDPAEMRKQFQLLIEKVSLLQDAVASLQKDNEPAPAPQGLQKEALTLKEITALTGVSPSAWWNGIKEGRYPEPIPGFSKPKRWRAREINELINERSEGK